MKTLREKIDRAAEIVGQIARLKEEYELLAKDIEQAALERPGEHVPLEDAEREGRQFLARGTEVTVPVILTADALMKSFRRGSPAHAKIVTLAGEHFPRFYADPKKFEIVEDDGTGAKLVQACLARDKTGTPKSAIKIDWSRAEKVEVAK